MYVPTAGPIHPPAQVQAKPINAAPGIANPAPLGLLCFGMTTVMLMFITTKWAEVAAISSVISYACFYGGFGQMVAGIFEVGNDSDIIGWLSKNRRRAGSQLAGKPAQFGGGPCKHLPWQLMLHWPSH
eukprot:GHUV01040617.1.p1 GENE.GHUV01040617.1~~GHUV01040617.1.p1  ORF type:complete len:128 (-),score=7.49 GHUV01040617.1:47-430(-)